MHEQAVMRDLVRHIVTVAEAEGATSVTQVEVQLGALSHFTPEHFREHYADATRGTIAEGASVETAVEEDPADARAADVVLLGMELEIP
jgi:hydrogenase nickel incorporation protein HypA/HybF